MSEFMSGCMSGLAQNIVGHPLDTLKIMIQNNKKIDNLSSINLFSKKYYKGFLYPTTLSILLNGISFHTNNLMKESNEKSHFKNGFITGFITSPIVYIFEVGKVKKQMRKKITFCKFYKTPGFTMTVLRESSAMSVYFGSYYSLTDNKYSPLFSGGMAGLINWTLTYPIDVIKNRQMTDDISIRNAIKIGKLWNGYSICAIRGIIVNSIGFYVYEYVKSNLNK
tara:strand:+ start:607 stop:1275 length:669 start_codon:yes stop_codon:yes gene_type:complete